MGAKEYRLWQAYNQLHPITDDRMDLLAGIVASTIASTSAAKGKRYKPADFMPEYWKPQRQSNAELQTVFAAYANAHNAAMARKLARSG